MPEIVNNSPLMDKPYDFEDSDKETMVKIDHVSMIFNMASELNMSSVLKSLEPLTIFHSKLKRETYLEY